MSPRIRRRERIAAAIVASCVREQKLSVEDCDLVACLRLETGCYRQQALHRLLHGQLTQVFREQGVRARARAVCSLLPVEGASR